MLEKGRFKHRNVLVQVLKEGLSSIDRHRGTFAALNFVGCMIGYM